MLPAAPALPVMNMRYRRVLPRRRVSVTCSRWCRYTWDTQQAGVALLLATRLQPGDAGRQATMQRILDAWVDGTGDVIKTPLVSWRCGRMAGRLVAGCHCWRLPLVAVMSTVFARHFIAACARRMCRRAEMLGDSESLCDTS